MPRFPHIRHSFWAMNSPLWLGLVVFWLPLSTGCGYFSSTPVDGTTADGTPPDGTTAGADGTTPESQTDDGSRTTVAPDTSAAKTVPPLPQTPDPVSNSTPLNRANPNPATPRPLMIGSFNIQRFGESKSAKETVMNRLMEIAYPFDVLAIQEVVSQKEPVVQNFVEKLNAKYGAKFNYVIGPFVGRTSYVERAAYIYDTSRVKILEQPFVLADPDDKLHREPLIARFQVREDLSTNPFSFVLINVHFDPQDGVAELDHTSDLLNALQSMFKAQEDDFLILGDFNLSPGKMFSETKFASRPEWKPVLDDRVMTNTRKDKAYDNILYHVENTSEFLRRQGSIDLTARFRISLDEALEISDHQPIWAAFALEESGPQNVAGAGTGPVR